METNKAYAKLEKLKRLAAHGATKPERDLAKQLAARLALKLAKREVYQNVKEYAWKRLD